MSTRNRSDSETLGSRPPIMMPKHVHVFVSNVLQHLGPFPGPKKSVVTQSYHNPTKHPKLHIYIQ